MFGRGQMLLIEELRVQSYTTSSFAVYWSEDVGKRTPDIASKHRVHFNLAVHCVAAVEVTTHSSMHCSTNVTAKAVLKAVLKNCWKYRRVIRSLESSDNLRNLLRRTYIDAVDAMCVYDARGQPRHVGTLEDIFSATIASIILSHPPLMSRYISLRLGAKVRS